MRTDLYTKVVLTVIAGCLLSICLGQASSLTSLNAQSREPDRVLITGWVDETGFVKKLPGNPNSALPVVVVPAR